MSKNSNSQITTKDSGFFTESVDDAKFIVACLILKLRLMQKDNPISKDLKKALKKHKKSRLNNQQVLDSYLKLSFKDYKRSILTQSLGMKGSKFEFLKWPAS